MQPVVAQRQIWRQHEAGFSDQTAVDIERRREILRLAQAGAHRPVFQPDPHLRRSAMIDVRPE